MTNVLLIEDDLTIVKLMKQYITELDPDIKVISFGKATDGLRYAKSQSVDLFLLDIQLEDYKGTSLAKQIRDLPQYKYTPIIFATALAGEELMAYREIKCYSFLVKPFTKGEFLETLKDALSLSKHLEGNTKTIKIEQKQFIFEYEIKNIMFIESFGKKVVIHTSIGKLDNEGDTISGYSLGKILELIDDKSIVQCHKSFLVNKNYIEKIDKVKKNIYLKNSGISIPIGNKYQSALWGDR